MKNRRVAVIGRGTGGCLAAAHMNRWLNEHEVEWYFDPSTPTKAVGEGTNLVLPTVLWETLGFRHIDLYAIDGSFKEGIYKEGWGEAGTKFFHTFSVPNVGYHFNALAFQDYVLDKLKPTVKIVEGNFTPDMIDADHVIDCSGKPKSFGPYTFVNVPVNAVYVSHCAWEHPKFQHTLTIARPWGWVFGIPLQNRCAVGYLYNKDISTLDQIKEDVEEVLAAYGLKRTREVQFTFNSYVAKQNFSDRVSLNGDKSFFLEPLEATSTGFITFINKNTYDIVTKRTMPSKANALYTQELYEIYVMIMLHYFSGSIYKTEFWDYAKEMAFPVISEALKTNQKLNALINPVLQPNFKLEDVANPEYKNLGEYGTWWLGSFFENIKGFGIEAKLKDVLNNGKY